MVVEETSGSALAATRVYRQLKEGIVVGRYRPNERLVETVIAEDLGISRTPVREALQRLAGDGLVTSRRRGWVVHEHGVGQIAEIYELRMALEGFAARLAADRATDEELRVIHDLTAAEVEQSALGDRTKLVAVNNEFHEAVLDAAHSPRLVEMARAKREYYFNFRLATLYTEHEARESLRDHGRIADALEARDPDAAEVVARNHISASLEIIARRGV